MDSTAPGSEHEKPREYFFTTRWTVVLSAGNKASPQSEQALGELCQSYWFPLYTYVRRQEHSKEDAEDLVQAFFSSFLEGNYLAKLRAERGKFRAFLLACLKHFLANEWDKSQRQKRGGGMRVLSLDWQSAEQRFTIDPPDHESPDRAYDRQWALALLERVIVRLQQEYATAEKAALFEQAKGYLMVGSAAIPYPEAAAKLSMDESAVRVAVHRMRKRYRELLREEIAQTLSAPGEVEEELRALRMALAG